MKPIDIFVCAYHRPMFTEQTLTYLIERTKYPYRLFLINNVGNDDIAKVYEKEIFMTINMSRNAGVTAAWQIAQSLAESEYFITSDNDIYVPDTTELEQDAEPYSRDWLTRMVQLMNERPNYGAISLHTHTLIGDASFDPTDPEDVKEVPWCGAVMRIMRTYAVRVVGGWANESEPLIRGDRGHEERTVCGRLNNAGYKTGRTTRIRAFHPFTHNWGYPKEITPEEQGHNPDLVDYVTQFDNMDSYDSKTWLPK